MRLVDLDYRSDLSSAERARSLAETLATIAEIETDLNRLGSPHGHQ